MAEDVKVLPDEIPTKRRRLDDICYNDEGADINETTNNDPDGFSNGQNEHDDLAHERAGSTDSTNKERDEEFQEQSNKMNEEEAETGADIDDSDNVSVISDLSGLSEEAWKSSAGSLIWIQKQMMLGQDPRNILKNIIPQDAIIPEELDDFTLWKLVINLLSEPPKRDKLKHVNTLDDVINLMKTCKKVIILTGAGVSVSCGIPDFRSRDGIYARLAIDFPDLPDPQAMFDIRYFRNDPRPFFKFAKEIYPGQFEPSKSHKFIRLFEDHNILLRNYTQNIDTLEQVAGIQNIIQCHGSFANATCMVCQHKVASDVIRKDIFEQVIPLCPNCPKGTEMAVMKPDIVFFGESLPEEFHRQMAEDKDICDLLIVIGSSLKVRPVALIPNSLPPTVPQILINREPLKHLNFDVELLGDCDTIVGELSKRLGEGWSDLSNGLTNLVEINRDELRTPPPEMLDSKPEPKTQTYDECSGKTECKEKTEMIESIGTTKSQRDLVINTIKPESDGKSQKKNDDIDHLLCEIESKLDPETTASLIVPDSCVEEAACNNDPGGSTTDDDELEKLRAMWQPRRKESIAKRLEEGQYLFLPPNRYVFQGAEVFSDDESDEEHFPVRLQLMSCSSMSSYEEESEIDTSSQSIHSVNGPSTSSKNYSEEPVKCLTPVDNDITLHQQSNGIDSCVDDKTIKTQDEQELKSLDQNETPLSSKDRSAADIS